MRVTARSAAVWVVGPNSCATLVDYPEAFFTVRRQAVEYAAERDLDMLVWRVPVTYAGAALWSQRELVERDFSCPEIPDNCPPAPSGGIR